MMKTLSELPIKTAHPPLVGKTARTCTSITVLFIGRNVIRPLAKNKRGAERCEIFSTRACMFGALIDYAHCLPCLRLKKQKPNEDLTPPVLPTTSMVGAADIFRSTR